MDLERKGMYYSRTFYFYRARFRGITLIISPNLIPRIKISTLHFLLSGAFFAIMFYSFLSYVKFVTITRRSFYTVLFLFQFSKCLSISILLAYFFILYSQSILQVYNYLIFNQIYGLLTILLFSYLYLAQIL